MKKFVIVTLVIAVMTGCAHRVPTSKPFLIRTSGVFEAHVVDMVGAIVVGAELQLVSSDGAVVKATSDEKGMIRFENVAYGKFLIRPVAPTWACAATYGDKGYYWKEVIVLQLCEKAETIS